MQNFKKGDMVRQVMPEPIAGKVTGFSVDQESGEVLTLVEFQHEDGSVAENYFTASQLELSGEAAQVQSFEEGSAPAGLSPDGI